MMFKLLALGFLSSTAILAIPSDIEEKEVKSCEDKVQWYRNITEETKELYDQYEKLLKDNPHVSQQLNNNTTTKDPKGIELVKAKAKQFKAKVAEQLNKYSTDADDLSKMSNNTARLTFCRDVLKTSDLFNKNLTTLAIDFKSNVTNIFRYFVVTKDVQQNFDKTLRRIVNFLLISNLRKNLFKDVNSLVEESSKKTDEGVELEKKYEFNGNGELVENAAAINEEFSKALETDEVDKGLEDDLKGLEDDRDIKAAEDKAIERVEAEEEQRRNGNEEEGGIGEPVEKPSNIGFLPEILLLSK